VDALHALNVDESRLAAAQQTAIAARPNGPPAGLHVIFRL